MYVPMALLVLLLTPIALVGRPLFYIAQIGEDAVMGNGFKGFALLPILLVISPLIVLYASLELLLKSNLGSYSAHNIFVELFIGGC